MTETKKLYAVSRIVHGVKDDKDIVFQYGDEVKGLDKETLQNLINAGAVSTKHPDAEVAVAKKDEELDAANARIEELEAQLAEAQTKQPAK